MLADLCLMRSALVGPMAASRTLRKRTLENVSADSKLIRSPRSGGLTNSRPEIVAVVVRLII